MTNELIDPNNKLALNTSQFEIFTQTTPKSEIRTRQGRGGKPLMYTDGAYVIRTLNQAFNWNWDFETDEAEILYVGEKPFEVKCRGRLTIRSGGQAVVKTQYGCQPIEMLRDGTAPVSLGDAFKGAATDALKKCASLVGVALDLYDSDSETVTGKAKPQPSVVVETPKPQSDNPTPEPTKGQLSRPMTPDQVKKSVTAKAKFLTATPPGEKQATFAFSSLSKACEGDEDNRHIIVEYLFGVTSMKELTAGQCSFIIDWIGAKAENGYTPNPDALKEIDNIIRGVNNLEIMIEVKGGNDEIPF